MSGRSGAVRCAVLLDGCPPFSSGPDAPGTATFAVVDDACSRLERVASAGLGAGPIGRWQRRSLVRSLRAAEPAGGDGIELFGLGRNATSEARACLVRTRATPATVAALEALAADGARLVSVTTPARLLARLYRRHPVPRLFVARTAVDERHALVVDGVACFARTVAPAAVGSAAAGAGPDDPGTPDPVATAAAVADSLAHLAGRHAAGRIDVAGIGLDDAALEACAALAHVGEARHLSRAGLETTLARRLAERVGGPFARRRTAHVPALLPESARADAGEANSRRATIRRTVPRAAVALGACLAVGAGGHAFGALARDRADAASAASERARLEGALAAGREALEALHPNALAAAARIERADALRASAPPDADALLGAVALALRDHASLRLDAVAWSVRGPGDGGERDAVFAGADALAARTHEPGAAHGAAVEVELAGWVLGAGSVRAAERALDAFVAALAALPGASAPTRLDSPLGRAAAGELVAGEGAGAGAPWRLRFAIGGRELEP